MFFFFQRTRTKNFHPNKWEGVLHQVFHKSLKLQEAFSNLITFLFLIHFKQFKVLQERHLKLYKSFLNSNRNRITYKEFFGCLGTGLCNVQWFAFLDS